MRELLKSSAISGVTVLFLLSACQADTASNALQSAPSLSDQIGAISDETRDFDDLPGETRAEKLLYQAGIVAQIQTASLVMFDTQIETVELAGNQAMANELKANRELLMQAMDKEVGQFVKDAGKLYETYFTPEEIERLIVLHSDPVMRKLVATQPELSQGILPAATEFGQRAGREYDRLSRQKQAAE